MISAKEVFFALPRVWRRVESAPAVRHNAGALELFFAGNRDEVRRIIQVI